MHLLSDHRLVKRRKHGRQLAGPLLLALCAFLIRLLPLLANDYVTPDEPAWVYRSIRFYSALVAHDWNAIPSTGHPGVTTMWLGTVSIVIQRALHPEESTAHLDWVQRMAWLAPENGQAFRHLAFFLPPGRIAVTGVTTLGLLAIYGLVHRRFGRSTALLATGLLAFDPFLAGHSNLLHTDALLSTFTLLALLTALNGAPSPHPARWWFLAGVFTGLALLTKTPALLLLPFLPALPLAHRPLSPRRFLIAILLFLLTVTLTTWVLFPALWAVPSDVVKTMGSFAGQHVRVVQRPIFFGGRMTYDPGPLFYPAVLLLRASPLVLVGLLIGLIRLRYLPADRRSAFIGLVAFALLFGGMMSIGAKKHDRYLLPALLSLTLAASIPLMDGKRLKLRPHILITLQCLIALPFTTHPLSYANPLVGGPFVAARVISLHWGEGMGAAARYLNRFPDASQWTTAAVNVPSFASIFEGHTIPIDAETAPLADYFVTSSACPFTSHPIYTATVTLLPRAYVCVNTASAAQAAYLSARAGPDDLILLDANAPLLRWYRGPGEIFSVVSLPNEAAMAEWLTEQAAGHDAVWTVHFAEASPITAVHLRKAIETIATPTFSTTVGSATITRYIPKSISSSIPSPSPTACLATFGGLLTLVDGVTPHAISWPLPATVTLRWQATGAPTADLQAHLILRDEEGHIWSSIERLVLNPTFFPTSVWAPHEWTDIKYELPLPSGIPPGRYIIEASLYDTITGARQGATRPDGTFAGTQVPVGEVQILPPAHPPTRAALDVPQSIEHPVGPMRLLGMAPLPSQVLSGDHLSLALFWEADEQPEHDYRVRLQLLSPSGEAALETVRPLSPHPTSRWREGDRFESRYTLHILPDLPPGPYRLVLNVLDTEGQIVAPTLDLAGLDILPRTRSFTLPAGISHPLDLTFGTRILLRGYDLDRTEVLPGDTLRIRLYWQAEGPTERDYTLFVHLLGPDGLPYGQVDRVPGDGTAPTSTWASRQVITEEILLPVTANAPPGAYHVAVGFYDPIHGHRLPVTEPSGRLLPDNQAILSEPIIVGGGS